MEWKTRHFLHIPYWQFSSILFSFHTKNLPIPYQGKFRPEAMRNLYCYCTFAMLSVPLQVVSREGKQCGTMHLIPYLKHNCNELPIP